jgi:hypothetical protein
MKLEAKKPQAPTICLVLQISLFEAILCEHSNHQKETAKPGTQSRWRIFVTWGFYGTWDHPEVVFYRRELEGNPLAKNQVCGGDIPAIQRQVTPSHEEADVVGSSDMYTI